MDALMLFTLFAMTGCAGVPVTPTAAPTDAPTSTSEPPTPTPVPTDEGRVSGEMVRSEKERVAAPAVEEGERSKRVAGNNAFALDLYQQVRQKGGNVFYSPYSVAMALAMTYAGARGETEEQMADVLHVTLPQDRVHPAFNALDLALTRRDEEGEETEEKGDRFRLRVANAVWGQRGYSFLPEYLDILAQHYGAGLRLLDFKEAPEEARQRINEWVSEETEGKIEDLIPKGGIRSLTRLVLTNAIYFNASWLHPFDEEQTHDGTFYPLGGGEITVPMMEQTERFRYAEGDGYQAVELPYVGTELSMVILLPETGQFKKFEDSLDAELVETVAGKLKRRNVAFTMPKFEFDASFQLASTLAEMGMSGAFSPEEANFSGMDGTRNLFLQDVVHKAFVSVDEAGTEAAAATGVVVGVTSAPPEPVEVVVDRPFVFVIRDARTGTILFVGRVVDPSA